METKRILLVEDNEDDAELTKRALKKNKILNDLVVARDGEEALRRLLQAETLPTVVLLDLKLPKMGGLEVLRQIREHEKTAQVPVVILTSSKDEQDIVEAYKNNCNSYIRKPVDFIEFTEAVNRLGIYWLMMNIGPQGARP